MTDWLKVGVGIIGAAMVAYAMLQQHEYRLGQIESGFKEHLDKHDDQYREIQKSLRDIDLTLSRITAARP